MFKLNEAPNLVLSRLSKEKVSRGCGLFWSYLCCLPTFGLSVLPAQDSINAGLSWVCCYPVDINLKSTVTLNVLIEKLKNIKITQIQLSKNQTINEKDLIEWQVNQTLKLLNKALTDNLIQGSYKDVLAEIFQKINTRVCIEQEFDNLLNNPPPPLSGILVDIPQYQFNKQQ